MASVELKSVSKSYGGNPVIRGVDLAIRDGEFIVFVGPSGCGKSTLLRLIAGLVPVTEGEISIGGEPVTDVPASKRGIAFVFQSYALYPHMTVARNIGFALETLGLGRDAVRNKVAEVAKLLKVDHLLARRPRELSGGQRQRVAIGRALVRKPEVFLFDEPLSNLDSDLRMEMRIEIARLHDDIGTTMIYVTHDQAEAMTLADRIVVLNHGVIEQVGSPQELYHTPKSRFVAGFVGSPRMNFSPVKATGVGADWLLAGPGGLRVESHVTGNRSTPATIGVRPEALSIVAPGSGRLDGVIERIEDLGHEHFAYVRLDADNSWVIRLPARPREDRDTKVGLSFRDEDLFLFEESGARLDHAASHERSAAAVAQPSGGGMAA
ncbi:ABC transporter ATP-binding protein [Mesorhizobium sp. BR1-1-16]|uniref:ABC transporter ATP-binding protein n=1 Tax=Mesorhizobium sp. BR1-1-16 TaxID=2876653 RepID=UPI001CCC8D06|nr:ABC transporter ATP-binding protein [Mesorhizobium sp. BR1-1-16]MBZ9939003.1 ABC transporter ATP-binding protein [Mesorhizobium sp. BR1-1-16]